MRPSWGGTYSTYNVQLLASVVYRHTPTLAGIFAIRKQLVHEVVRREASLREQPLLPILTENNVVLGQSRRGPNADCLLTCRNHVEADAPLPLRVKHDKVHDGYQQHVLI